MNPFGDLAAILIVLGFAVALAMLGALAWTNIAAVREWRGEGGHR